jgi:hypothetical protein
MAQTNFTPISLYYSATATNVPSASNLVAGELAINTADGKLFYKDSSNVVQVIGTKGGVGSSTNTQVLYNASGLVVGDADFTFNGTTVTMANDASISGLTVGKGGGAATGNSALGYQALNSNTTGTYNTAIGYQSLATASTTQYNTAVGQASLQNTTANNNTAVGQSAGYNTTTGNALAILGTAALFSNTTGQYNSAIGYQSLYSNTTASNNTAVGYQAGYSNTTGINNTAVGVEAGYGTTTASYSVFVGSRQGTSGNGEGNTIIGDFAGNGRTTGQYNCFVGQSSGYLITTGNKNTILGSYGGNQGGLDIRTASSYIVLSDGDGNPRQVINSSGFVGINNTNPSFLLTVSNTGSSPRIAVEQTADVAADMITFRRNGSERGKIYISDSATVYQTSSDYRLKQNIAPLENSLETIAKLKPSSFTWVQERGGKQDTGFIAHELAEVFPNAVTGQKDAKDAEGNPVYQGIDTSFLVATLTAAIQELNAKVEAQALEIATLKGN